MKLKSTLTVLVAIAAGIIGGALAYQVAVPASSTEPKATESIALKSPGDRARDTRRSVELAPCKRPARLEGRRCVTDVVRTVAVPARSAPASAPRAPAQAPTQAPAPAPSGSSWNDDGRHHGGDDESDHHGDDDDDDDDHGDDGDDDDSGTQTRTRSHD